MMGNVKSSLVSFWEYFRSQKKRSRSYGHEPASRKMSLQIDIEANSGNGRTSLSGSVEINEDLHSSITFLLRQPSTDSRYPSLRNSPFNSFDTIPTASSNYSTSSSESWEDLVPSNAIINLPLLREKHRLKMIALAQPHASRSSSFFKPKSHLTGDQMSFMMFPPEPQGENFRKWILVMETLFPNRATYLSSYHILRGARPHLKAPTAETHQVSPTIRPSTNRDTERNIDQTYGKKRREHVHPSTNLVPLRRAKSCFPAPSRPPSFVRVCQSPTPIYHSPIPSESLAMPSSISAPSIARRSSFTQIPFLNDLTTGSSHPSRPTGTRPKSLRLQTHPIASIKERSRPLSEDHTRIPLSLSVPGSTSLDTSSSRDYGYSAIDTSLSPPILIGGGDAQETSSSPRAQRLLKVEYIPPKSNPGSVIVAF